jgi:hypothetical protein
MFATGLRASWLGKHTLFRLPLAPLFRWLGGEPIDRASAQGTVGTAIEHFRTRRQWVLALTPGGTRRPVTQWKTGFHRIAVGAGVPIVPVSFDYRSRVVGIGAPVQPGPDESASVARLGSHSTRRWPGIPRNMSNRSGPAARSASRRTSMTSPHRTSAGSAGRKPRDDEIDAYGLSHPGKSREDNQDHFLIASLRKQIQVHLTSLPPSDRVGGTERLALLAMVADGVGGGPKGEEASRLAAAAVTRYVTESMQCYYGAEIGDEENFPPCSRRRPCNATWT